MTSAADVCALILTPDAGLASRFVEISRELGIVTHVSGKLADVPGDVRREKYEALLIDFDSILEPGAALAALRENASNRGAVIFAVATKTDGRRLAFDNGANFVLARPLDNNELRRTLYAAYDAMTEERRRYFRCTTEVRVLLTCMDGSGLMARTANLSGNGMSICSSSTFALGERIGIAFDMQNGGPHILARGQVVWDDKHGKTGISFQCVRPELQRLLDSWLDEQFKKVRQQSILELQKQRYTTAAAGN